MNKNFYEALKERRSIYNLNKKSPIEDQKIEEIIAYSVKHTPSAFNSQTGRVVLLLEEGHNNLWEMTRAALKNIVPQDQFQQTSDKIDSFKKGYGTVLFFEDESIVKNLQEQFPLYQDNFPIWSQQSSGMLQSNIWVSLAIEGLGGSLQHYNELIEKDVKAKWDIPESWKLMAQMPFGEVAKEADEKSFEPVENRMWVKRD
jgi:hypothetical protein